MARMTISVADETVVLAGRFTRDMSASKVFRYVVKAMFTGEKEWREFQKTDEEAAAVCAYLRKKLLPRLED